MHADQPAIRNSLLYLAFPLTFAPIVNQSHKRAIRNAFASWIDAPSGADPVSVDRDLLAIHTKQVEATGTKVNYYYEPYQSQWKKPDDAGRRAWLVRPRPSGTDLITRWRREGVVTLPAVHLPALEPGPGLAEITSMVEEAYQHEDYVRRLELATAFDIFCNRMKIDDIVVTDKDGLLYVGQITGEPRRVEGDERFSRAVLRDRTRRYTDSRLRGRYG